MRPRSFYTNCLDCDAEEGAFHAEGCQFFSPERPYRSLRVDLRQLGKQYGMNIQAAGIDGDRLVLIGERIVR